jgi:TgpA N-terminal domain/Transglutaminase-like superfamily
MNPRTQLAVAAAGVTLLSSTALHAVFVDTAWVAPVVGAVLAVLVGAELGSRLGQHLVARAVWRFVGSVLGTLFYITAVWAHQGAVLGFIPRGHTWHVFRLLTHKGFSEIHDLPTPAPTYRALMLITVVGVAGVAIAVDQLSVRAPLIGLPLLALYSVPEWLSKDGTGWIPLALGGSGYVGLLIREGRDRTSRWGRTVTGATTLGRNRSAAGAMSQAGWRIGAVALAVALVVPPLIPDLGHFNLAKGGGAAPNATVHYNPTAEVAGDLHQGPPEHLLSYSSSDGAGHYLRWVTLDKFQPSGFSLVPLVADPGVDPAQDALAPFGLTNTSIGALALRTSIAVTHQLGIQWLPAPVTTTSLDGLQGQWSYQELADTIFSDSETAADQRYTTTSQELTPLPTELDKIKLPKPSDADYAAVQADAVAPPDLPAKITALALAKTKTAKTEYQRAVALQDWFLSGQFHYSLQGPSGKGYAALLDFLTGHKQGFCQQFATAMTIMARALHIPARVAMGFTPGVQTTAGSYSVDNHDAHEWPELYFEGIGWLRFEPTPRDDHQTQAPTYADGLTVADIQKLSDTPTTTVTGAPASPTVRPKALPTENGHIQPGGGSASGTSWLPIAGRALTIVLVVVALVLVVAGVPLLQGVGRRRRRRRHGGDPREVALLAWRETLRDAYDLGYLSSVADSPRQAAHRLIDAARLSKPAGTALTRLAHAVERARYAELASDPTGLLDDAATVSAALFASAPRRARLRAKAVPPSTVAAAGDVTARAIAATSRWFGHWLDRVTALRNRVLRRRTSSA